MTDVETLIAESFERLYPTPAVRADWDDVVSRAGTRTFGKRRRDGLMARGTLRFRTALILLMLLLVLAAIATAGYLGAGGWLSAGPRAAQYQSGYRLTTAARLAASPVGWAPGGNIVGWPASLALAPGGHELYAMVLRPGATAPEITRIAGVDEGEKRRGNPVLDLAQLNVPGWCVWPFVRPVSVAGNGDVFFVAGGMDNPPGTSTGASCPVTGSMSDAQAFLRPAAHPARSPADSAAGGGLGHLLLFVARPDGSRQQILSGGDLVRSKLFPPDWMEWRIAASAPDRVWLWVDPAARRGPQRLFELIDADADGDWSDRIVRRVVLPASLPFATRATGRSYDLPVWSAQLAVEPSLPGDDRSRAILVGASNASNRHFHLYRIGDRNDDGDALDPGEAQLLLDRQHAAGAQVAERVVDKSGGVVRELVIAGLTRPDRVSLVSPSGVVTDIGRAFDGLAAVLAGTGPEVYPVSGGPWSRANASVTVYRLEPAAHGRRARPESASPLGPLPVFAPPFRPGEVPRLLFRRADRWGQAFATYTVMANGRGLRRFAEHVGTVCQSIDGRTFAFTSDAEVPTEFSTYLATSGTRPVRVTNREDQLACPFSQPWLVLYRPDPHRAGGPASGSLIRHDTRTGRETVLVQRVDNRYQLSPDGTQLVYVRPGTETLRLLDLETLTQRTLSGSLRGSGYGIAAEPTVSDRQGRNPFGLRWSPDGTRVAYVVAPTPRRGALLAPVRHRFVLWVRNATTGEPVLRRTLLGGRPAVTWSPDGGRLLVCVAERSFESGCPAGPGDIFGRLTWAAGAMRTPARLLLVDVGSGAIRTIATGPLVFAAWAPAGSRFAYATPTGLFLASTGGKVRKLASIAAAFRADALLRDDLSGWFGWSPDGRYIGLDSGCGEKAPARIQVIDVRTGRLRAIAGRNRTYYQCAGWWR